MLLTNIEFFTYQAEVWYRQAGEMVRLTESDTAVIDEMLENISTFYPKAYDALCKIYNGCALNKRYYRFRIVTRFIRCNFAQIDDIPDLSSTSFAFEFVHCPLHGECPLDGIVCRPEFDHKLSVSELPVMRLWFEGLDKEAIAKKLILSPHTVNNHIRNAYLRTNTHDRAEFVKYAIQHNLFS